MTLLVAGIFAPSTQASDEFRTTDTKSKHLDVIAPDGKPVLRYMYEVNTTDKETTFDTAKVYAHVMGPDGKSTLTKGAGGKFPHHRGIFIGWSKLKQDGKLHDLWHVRNTSQRHQKFVETTADETGATVTASIHWIGIDGIPVVAEKRTYQVVADDGAYVVVDFVSELTAVNGDVELNGDPEHAGVQFRPSQEVAENKSAEYTFHADGIPAQKYLDLPWVAETFVVQAQSWTVQHMNHPENPKGARWSAYRDYGRFGPFTVVKIPDGKAQVFRYRFRITKGEAPTRDSLANAYRTYTGK